MFAFCRDIRKMQSDHLVHLAVWVSLFAFSHLAIADEPAHEIDKTKAAKAPVFSDQQIQFFEKNVRPLLIKHCNKCHGDKGSRKGGLRLNSRSALLKGGDSGPAADVKSPGESLLLEALNYESLEMPPRGKLPQKEIDVFTKWVEMGLPWPAGEETDDEHEEEHGPPAVNQEARQFWSFQPVSRPDVPTVKNERWVNTPVDHFILAKLEAAKLTPASPANKTVLLRRAYYDLIGLPPTPEQVATFLSDDSETAFENVVNQLLKSPHYGEHWARKWLDLVRYAESNSYERDDPKPFVWRYRDYVIRSFNNDKPYNNFIREQLAGDEFDNVTDDTVIATGYYRLGIWDDEPTDRKQAFYDDMDDVLSTTGQAFLGLTIGCARCHDHKLDPIPQKDYYRMLAFFRNVQRYGVRGPETVRKASLRSLGSEEEQKRYAVEIEKHKAAIKAIDQQLEGIEAPIVPKLVGGNKDDFKDESSRPRVLESQVPELLSQEDYDKYAALFARRDKLRKSPPAGLEQALCVKEHDTIAPPTHVLVRGNAAAPGEEVVPGVPSVLEYNSPALASISPKKNSTGRRLALANWIADDKNPLTARVMVNRIWQHHFGKAIVASPNNFGFKGRAPTHPELLDWLTAEFVASGWKMKRLHKLIMLSQAYQMSPVAKEPALEVDPENKLLHSFRMRRLTAEEIRDSILAVNGQLNLDKMFGPSIYPTIPQAVLQGQSQPGKGWGKSTPRDQARRSIYIHIKRSLMVPILESFDTPVPDTTCPVRFSTTQPTQALNMLNSAFINKQAKQFASHVRKQAGDDILKQVTLTLNRVLQREPTSREIHRAVKFITVANDTVDNDQALTQFCILALNMNEFMFLD